MSLTSRSTLQFSPFHIPANVDLLYCEEKMVALERRAVQVLRYLVEHHDRVVTKDELLEAVWPDTFITDGVLKRAISQARRALGDVADKARFIETYHGRGYRFVAQVERREEAAAGKPAPAEQPAVQPPIDTPRVASPELTAGQHSSLQAATLAPSAAAAAAVAPVKSAPAFSASCAPDYNQLVGRETEMAQLQADYRRTLAGAGQPVLLIGEPGIGKTQLAREFAGWAQAQGAACLYAQFFDYQASRLAPYEVFLDLIRSILGINASNREDCDLRVLAKNHFGVELPEELFADARAVSQLRTAGITNALRLEDASPYKTAPLNPSHTAALRARQHPVETRSTGKLSGGQRSHHQAGQAGHTGMLSIGNLRAVAPIGQCFIRASHHRPLVIVLDDVQWADEASREVMGHLMRSLSREPLMIVCLARAEALLGTGGGSFADWMKRLASSRSYTTLTLKPLDQAASRSAIDAVFGGGINVPPADLQTLHGITGGNPYFLVEMLRLLVMEKIICLDQQAPGWKWQGIKNVSLPVTIVMAAQAKLDRLSEEVRDIVECAAVLGDEFRIETLALVTGRDEDEIERLLLEGVRRGVLVERGVSGDNDARFHHTTLRRVLYEAMPLRRRKRVHLRAAQALEGIYKFELDRVAEAISAHYEAAPDWDKTFEWGVRAWQAASSRLSWSEALIAIERAERAASAMEHSHLAGGNPLAPAERLKLLFALGETHFAVGDLKKSDAFYNEAIQLARTLNDRAAMATALLQQGETRLSQELYQESIAVTRQALEIYRATGDAEGAAMALLQLSNIEVRQGNYDRAIELAQKSLEDVALNSEVAAIAFGLLGWARALQGHFTEGVPLLERAVEYLSGIGDTQRRLLLLRRSHWAELSRGRYETAIELAVRARDDAQRIGDATGEATMEMGIGHARLLQGLRSEAVEFLTRARQRARAVGDTRCEAESLWLLGSAHCEMGDARHARELLERALEMILETGDRHDECRALTALARVALAESDGPAALQFTENAQVIAEEIGITGALAAVLIETARALLALSRHADAMAAAERALALMEENESGERWRACWIKARILTAQNVDSNDALDALKRTVALLDEIRGQLAQDEFRYAAATKALRLPAQQLHALLQKRGMAEGAQKLAQAWNL